MSVFLLFMYSGTLTPAPQQHPVLRWTWIIYRPSVYFSEAEKVMFVLINQVFPRKKKTLCELCNFFYSWSNYFSSSCFYFFIHSDQYEKGITEAKINISVCVIFKAGVSV